MKTPEEIKNALAHCRLKTICDTRCPYYHEGCGDAMRNDALAYIGQLEEQIALMLIQMKGDCGVCKHRSGCFIGGRDIAMSRTCYECMMNESRPNWEYEGLPE